MIQYLRKMLDSSGKEVKELAPVVERINELEESIQALSDDQLKAKTEEFKKALESGQTQEQILPEAFAVVREMSKRTLGMRQFDVQMVGGVVLHRGSIAEMKTGEGKTLVAVAPMYLNALSGKGAHLVTVNDYLARRDAVWMGPIYHSLGLTVGIIQGHSPESDELGGSYIYDPSHEHEDPRYRFCRPCSRREAYLCDITYGTNHEFGFDYLRDNMAFAKENLVMRTLNYALVDEVDSILIDEARVPHIISGPSAQDVSVYKEIDAVVKTMNPEEHWSVDKKANQASLTEEGMDFMEHALELDNITDNLKLFHHVGAAVRAYALFEKDVDYVVRNGEVVIVDQNTGRMMPGRRWGDGLHQAIEAKEGVTVQRESQTYAVITFQNLFRMYEKLAGMTGTAKTEEGEFQKIYGLDVVSIPTHRDMVRIDREDVVYKTLDAKCRGIAREILRLYSKQQPVLVGTRSIEKSELISSWLTSEMLQKLVIADMILDKCEEKSVDKSKASDAKSFVEKPLGECTLKQLSGIAASIDVPSTVLKQEVYDWFIETHDLPKDNSKYLEEALKHGIPHNVLNAKYHEKEAAIISEAGRKGAVTIATNMAGRGVDILLGGRVEDDQVRKERAEESGVSEEFADTFLAYRRGGQARVAPPLPLTDQERSELAKVVREVGGLYILGTERHESRRIDNQLRGRAGRQGDPGESRFFVSLEDDLWKIFNSKMMENPMLKAWPALEQIQTKFISRMILKTQERIENHFFEARKHTLEYDDILNAQRERIYGMRREILLGKDCREDVQNALSKELKNIVRGGFTVDEDNNRIYDYSGVFDKVSEIFPIIDYMTLSEFKEIEEVKELEEKVQQAALDAYQKKLEEIGEEVMPKLEQQVMLRAVNEAWMDHLQIVDYIREGIRLRGYGQTDPLVAFKRETHDLYENTMREIGKKAASLIYRMVVQQRQPEPMQRPQMQRVDPAAVEPAPVGAAAGGASAGAAAAGSSQGAQVPASSGSVDWKTVGRNEPCPCGSGKKFKVCHYPELRKQGII